MVSMKDIAAACGVSVATVSKALNNHSDISDETKAVIKQKAREMGYHPNFSARALKTNKSYNIGVLYKDDAGSGLTHDYFAWVLENFKVTAENNGYDITFLNNSRLKKDRMSYLEHSIYRGMDGVMIAIADYKNPEVIELLQGELPVVTIDYVYNGRISIMSDNVEGMQALLQYAYDKGHRRDCIYPWRGIHSYGEQGINLLSIYGEEGHRSTGGICKRSKIQRFLYGRYSYKSSD